MRQSGFGITGVLGAFIGGAAAMYFLDARDGARRRALVRDRAIRAQNIAIDTIEHFEKDFENRTKGVISRLGRKLERRPVTDDVLLERVRAKLGHVCTHPSAIRVYSKGKGVIELKGPVLAREKIPMLAALALIPGVRMIDDDLDVHTHADVPALRGHARRVGPVARHWNPTTRGFMAATGAVCLIRAARGSGGPISLAHFAIGASLLGASFVNLSELERRRETLAERVRQHKAANQGSFL